MFQVPVRFASGGRIAWILVCCCVLSFGFAQATFAEKKDEAKKALKVGDVAPEFAMKGTDGKTHKLSDFKGKQAVIVAWYPKALTGG